MQVHGLGDDMIDRRIVEDVHGAVENRFKINGLEDMMKHRSHSGATGQPVCRIGHDRMNRIISLVLIAPTDLRQTE